MRLLRAVWLCGVLTACGPGTGVGTEDVRGDGEVRELIAHYYRDFNSHDWEALADYFWSGADITTVWQAAGESVDRVVSTSIDEFIADAPRDYLSEETFEAWIVSAEVRVYRDLAQAWVWYGAKLDSDGELAEWDGIDAFTLLKHEDVWKIAALMFTSGDQ
jgi:hypothetical protein